ncbi:hypothetical protein [Massilia sp. S19_KUP03_FR1]|uniref:hypothetical protein n=1 Tax=Massilia sp. S19_KUP03_FR1 TaxID=3025503 RepID=UPI002FCDD420
MQALPKGGAQGLLAPLAQTALGQVAGNVADKLTGGAARAGKLGAAVAAPPLGLPGSLPRLDAEIAPAPLQKSVL